MKLLAIPLGCQKTTTKWLVITQQKTLGKSLMKQLAISLRQQSCQVIGYGYSHSTRLPTALHSHLTDETTGKTTSHPTKQPEDGCQVVGYSQSTDGTTKY